MEGPVDRRHGPDRRAADGNELITVRGWLHDLGHDLTTLSYLVEVIHADPALSAESAARVSLVSRELSRLLDAVAREMFDDHVAGLIEAVDVRVLAGQVAELATAVHATPVVLRAGPEVKLRVNPTLLWRVLSNVVDNAARATSPDGQVELAINGAGDCVIDVIDNGPGFRHGPPGLAALGLRVVSSLLGSCGGTLEVHSPEGGGTRVRMTFPGQPVEGTAWTSAEMGG
jgi:signal transduction histidine kinase